MTINFYLRFKIKTQWMTWRQDSINLKNEKLLKSYHKLSNIYELLASSIDKYKIEDVD
jgi:hypothetical protein